MEALTEDEHRRFLVEGYLERRPHLLTDDDHRRLYDEAANLYELARAADSPTAHLDILGDNLRARIPTLDRLLGDPAIDGVLTDLLGPDYLVHPHSYCHRAGTRDQVFHQDGNLPWNERGHARSHRTDWLMLFYYPQRVDADNGPTEVVPGTQYWTVDHEKADGGWHPGDRLDRTIDDEIFTAADLDRRDRALADALDSGLGIPDLERRFLHVREGTVVIAHYDLVHRGSRALPTAADRFMYKFYLARVHEPGRPPGHPVCQPSASADGAGQPTVVDTRPELEPVVGALRRWSAGPATQPSEPEAGAVAAARR